MQDANGFVDNYFLISLGAVSGSYLRYQITNRFSFFEKKYWRTMAVNLISTFFLGFILSAYSYNSYQLNSAYFLLIGVGFLGSMSTFSAFIIDVLTAIRFRHFRQSFFLLIVALLGGILFAFAGYWLGHS